MNGCQAREEDGGEAQEAHLGRLLDMPGASDGHIAQRRGY